MSRNSRSRLRRSAASGVVWVKSPVKITKSSGTGEALMVATAWRSVLPASGFAAPEYPQCVSDNCKKVKGRAGATTPALGAESGLGAEVGAATTGLTWGAQPTRAAL